MYIINQGIKKPSSSMSLASDAKVPKKASSALFLCVFKHPERAGHMADAQ